jgi:hypothetical protein
MDFTISRRENRQDCNGLHNKVSNDFQGVLDILRLGDLGKFG